MWGREEGGGEEDAINKRSGAPLRKTRNIDGVVAHEKIRRGRFALSVSYASSPPFLVFQAEKLLELRIFTYDDHQFEFESHPSFHEEVCA
jgi:hypothetical protein